MVATPSAEEFKARYPEFNGVDDSLVTSVIAEASPMVDDDWHEPDQKPAIMALTAHLLNMEGWPTRVSLPAGSPVPPDAGREMIMRRVGDTTVQYAQTSGGGSGSGGSGLTSSLGLTMYGRRFQQLLKLNVPAIGLV